MRIGIAGLATSHPYTDARGLRQHAQLVVWEPDAGRLARFREEHPDAVPVADLDALLRADPDGVVLTVPTPEVPGALARILDRDLACFVNKPAAASRAQLSALRPVVARAPHRVLSSSVLRFAPSFAALADTAVDRADLLAARVTVRHDVGLWATGYNPWQDDPASGGGTIVSMGIHGVELLVALLGPAMRVVGATASIRRYGALRSEDTALVVLRWDDGLVATVEVLGVTAEESYEVILHATDGDRGTLLRGGPGSETALGYRATIEAFLSMVDGAPSPVPWEQTEAVLGVLADARAATDPGRRERA
ncbi:Gfo/Idh/MocA family protein [Rugosimonospora africana]|uniref:GFO/IDH/MocA-like oxidoreductase domain-containing protein n=1 Tax=Rugosimonospora africana TaxID=556532 RepID=A0A8J3QZG5_9ACTN|nr:Gfo/Idh/MocA family oxidoreductase [Rugosimonospora africana]GIH19743.1 hypothetical protein Raf01_79150 [Rugosimonospora africana]